MAVTEIAGAAWEWRAFSAADAAENPLAAARRLATRLGVEVAAEPVAEDDVYLVGPFLRHNLKVRRGTLQLKLELRQLTGGFSLWADKVSWSFPIELEGAERLWSALSERLACPPIALRSTDELVWYLRHHGFGLRAVTVRKQRVRLELPDCRLEVASVFLPGGVRLLSYCVDGYRLSAVRECIRKTGLGSSGVTSTYVDLLRQPLFRSPSLSQTEGAA